MKKIICPTDFSPAANNALEYAAILCKMLKADLEIVNLQLVSIDNETHENTGSTLSDTCMRTAARFNIKCTYTMLDSNADLPATIAQAAKHAGLVVMGTSGMDEVYEYFFGTFSYGVSKKAKCPVLIVPDGSEFRLGGETVVAWNYEKFVDDMFLKLSDYRMLFSKEIVMLHVSKHATDASKDVFRISSEEVKERNNWGVSLKFVRMESHDPIESIDEYMTENQAKLLVLNNYHWGLWPVLFHGSLIKTLCNKANYPILILHED